MPQVVYEGDGGDIVTAEEQRQRKSRYLKLKVSNCTQADLYWSCQLISVKRWMMPGNIELGASDCLLQSRACHVILLRLRLPDSQTTGLPAAEQTESWPRGRTTLLHVKFQAPTPWGCLPARASRNLACTPAVCLQ